MSYSGDTSRAELTRRAKDGNADAIDELVQRAVERRRVPGPRSGAIVDGRLRVAPRDSVLVTTRVVHGEQQTVRVRVADLFVGKVVEVKLGRHSTRSYRGKVLTVAIVTGGTGGGAIVVELPEESNRRPVAIPLALVASIEQLPEGEKA